MGGRGGYFGRGMGGRGMGGRDGGRGYGGRGGSEEYAYAYMGMGGMGGARCVSSCFFSVAFIRFPPPNVLSM